MKARILVAEDEKDLRDLYVYLLQMEGYDVESASDGETALDKLLEKPYDLVLLDIMMPKRDGIDVLEALRAHPPPHKIGRIVLLTNLTIDSMIDKSKKLGARGYLVKSNLDPAQFLRSIASLLAKR